MYYFIAVIQVYFISELVKQSGWIHLTSHQREYHFNHCISHLKPHVESNHLYTICDILNDKEDFTRFVNNIIHCNLIIYFLTREIIPDYTVFDIFYWCVVTLSTVGFSLMNIFPVFQFSFQGTSTFTHSQIMLCICVSCLLLLLILYQSYKKRINYRLFVFPLCLYIMIYILFRSITSQISWHLHHVITFGFLSLCFAKNRFIHAIMIGGVIQGINVYGLHELYLFSIDYVPEPSFIYLSCLSSIFFILWNIIRQNINNYNDDESNYYTLIETMP